MSAPIDPEKLALEADHALRATPDAVRTEADRRGPRIVVLPEVSADGRGIVYRRGSDPFLLPWHLVAGAHAAEVGEPEGVQTVVFDLVLAGRSDARCRFDADPGDPACRIATRIVEGIGRSLCSASLRAAAIEGRPTRSYPDLGSYEDDAPPELLRSA